MKKLLLINLLLIQTYFTYAQITPSIGFGNIVGAPSEYSYFNSIKVNYTEINKVSRTLGFTLGGFKKGATFGYFFNSATFGPGLINVIGTNETPNKIRVNSHYLMLKDILGNKLYGFDRHFFSIDYAFGITDISILDFGNFKEYAENIGYRERQLNQIFLTAGVSIYKKILNPNVYLYASVLPTFYPKDYRIRVPFNIGIMTPFL